MAAQLAKTDVETALAREFADARPGLPGSGALAELRAADFARFEALGLPHRRVEDWKYTDLRNLMREALPVASPPDAAALAQAREALAKHALPGARVLVMADGHFIAALSDLAALEPGLSIRTLAETLASPNAGIVAALSQTAAASDPMFALNGAMMGDGIVIDLADETNLARPIQLIHVACGGPASAYTRSLVRAGRNARATLAELFIATGAAADYQVNDAVLFSLDAGARIDHARIMEEAPAALHVATLVARVGAQAHFNTFNLTAGGAVSRYQAFIGFEGEGATVETNGVNLIRGTQHADTTLFLDHARAHCTSREQFRAVVDNRARSVFQGKIVVQQEAQKTDAKMMARALLLSDEAEADAKPELEIYADDVACGHGATSGALDQSLLFYLRARGLPEAEAQALLVQAFVGEAIESIVDEGLRDAALATAIRFLKMRGN
jgi:Fe-S cluster assembly protein SufD